MDLNERVLAYNLSMMKRLNVSVDEDLHRQLKMAAAAHGITIGQFVSDAIREKIEKDEVVK